MIKIKTEKVVRGDGNEYHHIKGIEALEEENLPQLYLVGAPRCFLYSDKVNFTISTKEYSTLMTKGDDFTRENMNKALSAIRKCGDRLKVINDSLREQRKTWNGTETFVI